MGNIILGSDGITVRQGIYEESVSQKAELGRFLDFEDGRRFRYCKASGAITKGHLCTTANVVADDNTITQTGMTVAISNGYIGETVINVLLAAATTLNLYEDGLFVVEGGVGLGQAHRIRKNKAGGAAVATPCELTLYDGLVVALDATSIITLTKNRYKDVVIGAATTVVGSPIGVPLITVTTGGYYFWAQTRGYCPIVVDDDGTLTVGMEVVMGGGDTGAVLVCADATLSKRLGVAIQVAAIDTYATIDLMLE